MPVSPHSAAGMRIEPPPSEPVASGTSPAARAAADPPDEPPGVRSVSHGLRVMPKSRLDVSALAPSSGVLVLPTTTQPAARRRATKGESAPAGASSLRSNDPWVVTKPVASSRSFTPIGMPANGPGSPPGRDRLVHQRRVGEGQVAVDRHERPDGRVDRGDALERGLRQLASRHLLRPDLGSERLDRGVAEVHVSTSSARRGCDRDRVCTGPARSHAPRRGRRDRSRPPRCPTSRARRGRRPSTTKATWLTFSPVRAVSSRSMIVVVVHPQGREQHLAPPPLLQPFRAEAEHLPVPGHRTLGVGDVQDVVVDPRRTHAVHPTGGFRTVPPVRQYSPASRDRNPASTR